MASCSGWQTVNPVCHVEQAVGGVANDAFSSIANYFGKASASAVNWLWRQIDSATAVDLTGTGIRTDLVATGAIAAVMAFGLFVIQVIASGLRQDPGGLLRAVRGLGVAFIGSAFAIASTQILLAAVDSLSDGVVKFALGTNVSGMGQKLLAVTALTSIGNPAGILLMSLILLAAVVVIWGALMVRKLLIIISAVFAPVAFSGAASDISRAWVRRWIEFTAALVFSKLILVIVFMIGLSVLDGAGKPVDSGGTQSVTNLAIGALTLFLAAFAPWIAIRTVHFAGDSFQHVHAQAAAARSGAQAVVAAPQKVQSTVQQGRSMMPSAASTRAGSGGSTGGSHLGQGRPQSGAGSTAANGTTAGAGAATQGIAGPPGVVAGGAVAAGRAAKAAATRAVSAPMQADASAPRTQRPPTQPDQRPDKRSH